MRSSTREAAQAAQTQHQFVAGLGYLAAGPGDVLPKGTAPAGRCIPPTRPENGSAHRLMTPGGVDHMVFYWVTAEQAWARPGGKRMAFTADYLSSHGWTYDGPV